MCWSFHFAASAILDPQREANMYYTFKQVYAYTIGIRFLTHKNKKKLYNFSYFVPISFIFLILIFEFQNPWIKVINVSGNLLSHQWIHAGCAVL